MAKAKKERAVYSIEVDADGDCTYNDDGDENGGQYSYRGTSTTSWTINGLRLLQPEQFSSHSAEVLFKPVKGKIYHLLFAIYSTGDTFGRDDGRCFEVIGVYKNRKIADENYKRLWEGKPVVKTKWGERIVLKVEGIRERHEYYPPWNGYFESLDRLDVLSFILN